MRKYAKPIIKMTVFKNQDNNMALVSGNYNTANFIKNGGVNIINLHS